jgi:hypothetical protein
VVRASDSDLADGRNFSPKLQSTSAQTPGKTEEYPKPESKTKQQDREPAEICKTSIPGSNPGGASNSNQCLSDRLQQRLDVAVPEGEGLIALWVVGMLRQMVGHHHE